MTGTLDQRPTLDSIKHQFYVECFIHDNAVETEIETQDVVHALGAFFCEGHSNGSTTVAGITGTTSAFADYGATVTGTVKATDGDHGLSTGDIITINGGDDYAGIYEITVIDSDNFYFTATWNDDDGVVTWTRPDIMLPVDGTNTAALFLVTFSVLPASANQVFEFHLYRNTDEIDHFKVEQKLLQTADMNSISMTGVDPIVKGDKFWIGITNTTSTANLLIKHGNTSMVELI